MSTEHRHVPVDTGATVGKYVLGRRLGAGGMGAVYECRTDGGIVAVKVPYCETLESQYTARRFVNEGIAGSIIDHPNVVRVYDHGETETGIPYLVMEQVHGEHLCMKAGRDQGLSLRRAASIVRQLLDGLVALHAAGIVHGDVKSDNVLVGMTDDGHDLVKLIDFGLAHPDLEDRPTRPRSREMVSGTPDFMAPEVIRGADSTAASDIYAAGVILYELVTGVTPFAGGNSTEIVNRHLREPVLPPSLRRPDREIPPILERIILRALEKDPAKRFASAASFASALTVAIPSLCEDEVLLPTFSLSAPTQDWNVRDSQHDVSRRVARGTPAGRRRAG
jgi:serine/threonine protein kinase